MSVLDDGTFKWLHQNYWETNAGYTRAWLELCQNLNQRCDFMGVTRPTVSLMQPDSEVDPVTWLDLCSSAETPDYVFDMITAMQAALDQWSRSTHAALESQYTPELPTEPPPEVVMLGRGGRRYGMGSRDPLGNRQGFGRLMPGHAPIL